MLHILLLILKIIGIIILAILGLFIIVVCAIFFSPVRYEIKSKKPDEDGNVYFYAKISYLFRYAYAYVKYEKGAFDWKARIGRKKYHEMDFESNDESKKESPRENERRKKKKKKLNWFEKLKKKIKRIWNAVKNLYKGVENLTEFFADEAHKESIGIVKTELVKLVKHIRPSKVKGFLRFGFSDPYRTGQVLAFLSVLYPLYGERIQIYPDFENEVFEEEIYIKGHVRFRYVYSFLANVVYNEQIEKTIADAERIL